MAKKKDKTSKNSLKIFLGLLIITLFFLMAYFYKTQPASLKQFSLTHKSLNSDDVNEDQLSLYNIPPDVLSALDQARSTGNPVLGIRADGPSYHIPILMYHYVEHVKDPGDKIRISLNTLPEILDQQLNTLVKANYTFLTASDLADILDGIKQPPPRPVVLTFDDGYRDFYTDAFPILKKYNVKAVNYVVSGFIDKPNNLTSDQLQEIAKSGLVEIGSHTINHLALAEVSESKAMEEIYTSKIALEQRLGVPVTVFAYPYGSFNLTDIQLVRKAGYRMAVSTIPGSQIGNEVRFFAYRLRPGVSTGQGLLMLLKNRQ